MSIFALVKHLLCTGDLVFISTQAVANHWALSSLKQTAGSAFSVDSDRHIVALHEQAADLSARPKRLHEGPEKPSTQNYEAERFAGIISEMGAQRLAIHFNFC